MASDPAALRSSDDEPVPLGSGQRRKGMVFGYHSAPPDQTDVELLASLEAPERAVDGLTPPSGCGGLP